MAYIYMVRCADGSLYTGIAVDVGRRMREHYYRKKHGAKYTKSHPIKSLEMVWETEEWSYAAKLEYRIKRLRRSEKEDLIRHPEKADRIAGTDEENMVYHPHPEMRLEHFLENINNYVK